MASYNLRNRPVSTIMYKTHIDKETKKQLEVVKTQIHELDVMYSRIERLLQLVIILLFVIIMKELYLFLSANFDIPELVTKLNWTIYKKCEFDMEKVSAFVSMKADFIIRKANDFYSTCKMYITNIFELQY